MFFEIKQVLDCFRLEYANPQMFANNLTLVLGVNTEDNTEYIPLDCSFHTCCTVPNHPEFSNHCFCISVDKEACVRLIVWDTSHLLPSPRLILCTLRQYLSNSVCSSVLQQRQRIRLNIMPFYDFFLDDFSSDELSWLDKAVSL